MQPRFNFAKASPESYKRPSRRWKTSCRPQAWSAVSFT